MKGVDLTPKSRLTVLTYIVRPDTPVALHLNSAFSMFGTNFNALCIININGTLHF